jgi:hypothetical protein
MASEFVYVVLSKEALNCLAFWMGHPMYGDTPSQVIVDNMDEWLMRDRSSLTLDEVKSGDFQDNWDERSRESA